MAERAAALALSHELRSLDALHLAAALLLPAEAVTVATWDVRLHRAARAESLAVLPERVGPRPSARRRSRLTGHCELSAAGDVSSGTA